MVLLIAVVLLSVSQPAYADIDQTTTLAVIFDSGDPGNSVGIVGQTIVEVDDIYESYRIRGLDDQAVIIEHVETNTSFRMPSRGDPDPAIMKRARDLFVVKQLKNIFKAQLRYLDVFKDHFAPDLATLQTHGYLDPGFKEGSKQNYQYEILSAGQTKRRTPHFKREPTFMALAEPEIEEGLFYFTVDQLGQVRFAETRYLATWGPVWDYADHGAPRTRDIQVDS